MTTYSGRVLGAHQKIDRIARRHLELILPGNTFPKARKILHFEGGNGPDAIKRKSPAKDEPWHYFQPFEADDTQLPELIERHYEALKQALSRQDDVRAAFEAAWLAHAIVDGLTPAHHYPYEEELTALRGGQGKETRTSLKEKLMMHGDTHRERMHNNWKMWGPKGLFTTHGAFEMGVATLIMPLSLKNAVPTKKQIEQFHAMDVAEWFRQTAQEVANLKYYDRFYQDGWTTKLAREVRRELAPMIVRAVTLAWHGALQESKAS